MFALTGFTSVILRNMKKIDIVCSVGDLAYETDSIMEFIQNADLVSTEHGERFTGRPGTRLLVGENHVIKCRTEYQLPEKDARKFVQRACSLERELGVYHPQKTWFLIYDESLDAPVIANVTPRLQPLHEVGNAIAIIGEDAYDDILCELFSTYLRVASTHDVALDISLSNFAVDTEGRLFYVDDESYAWDNFTSLCHFLGILIRGQERIGEVLAARLGTCLRQYILRDFTDAHWAVVVGEQLRGLFVPDTRRKVLSAMANALRDHRTVGATRANTSKVIALLADIHANAPALESALTYLSKRGITEGLIMGDVVGYGPHPAACIDMLFDKASFGIVKGNHDHAVCTGNYSLGFSPFSRWVVEWTIRQLDTSHRSWLANLPLYLLGEEWMAVHGAPTDKTFFNAYVYDMTYEENLETLRQKSLRYCFHGHTHLQKVYYRKRHNDRSSQESHQQLADYDYALICPGSVGQPRGGTPGCELALLDTETWELELIRLPYDMTSTLNDMRRQGFPSTLVDRLTLGK